MRNKLRLILFVSIIFLGLISIHSNTNAQSIDFTYNGVCVGNPTNFSGSATGMVAASWSWNFGDGNFGNGQFVSNTYLGSNILPGYTATLTVVDNLGNTYTKSRVISVQDLPTAFFSFITPTCSNDSVRFQDHSFSSPLAIKRWVWSYDDGSPNDTIYFPNDPNKRHLFATFGTYNITLEVTNDSCSNSTTIPVTVIPGPTANFFVSGQCEGQIVQFTDASTAGGAGNVEYWHWDFGDPGSGINNTSDIKDPTHNFMIADTFYVTLTVTNFNNCTDTITKQIIIHEPPAVDFTYGVTCMNELINFDADTSVMEVNAIATWNWDFGDGISYNNNPAAHLYTAPGDYIVTLTVTDTLGCINTITHVVHVNPLPLANFDAGVSNCAGAVVQFQNLSTTSGPTAGYITRWVWDFGDGNIVVKNHPDNPNVTHTYALPNTYNVTLTVTATDSCTDTESQQIIIHPNPVANFSYSNPCFGTAVDFTDLSQLNGGGSIVQWEWNFGDFASGISNLSPLPEPSHTFSAAGTYQVVLVVTSGNGCTASDTAQVVVKPQPLVEFTSTNNCQNNAVIFEPDITLMDPSIIVGWLWDFGDGGSSPSQNTSHVYPNSGTYNVTLTVTDTGGCSNSITKPIFIIPQPNANFTFSQPACKDSEVTFTNLSNAFGYIVKNVWNFGDGNTLTINTLDPVSHIYTNYGTYPVSLTITTNDSCKRTFTQNIVVEPNPSADFTYLTSCVNSPVQFNDLSQAGAGGLAGWLWDFGDPSSGANNIASIEDPAHTFTAAATYNVSLIVTNTGGCQDTITLPVVVNPLPLVDFTISAGCVNDSTHFVSSGTVIPSAVASLLWDFGDGFTATNIADPYHIYANSGSYLVTLTVTDIEGCVNSKSHTVSIVPPPVSFFQVSTQTCANNPIFFTNQSTTSGGSIISYFWDFGDGNDTLINAPASGNVSHIYTVAGNFPVILTINTSLGCEADFQRTITVSASPLAQFDYTNTCEDVAVQFNDLSQLNSGTSIVNWLWDFGEPASGNNNTSTLQNPLHIYSNAGTYTVLLLVENGSGCPDTVSQSIVINPKPAVDYSWTSTCIGTTTTFTTNTTVTNIPDVVSFDWDFGDGSTHNTQQNPVHNYTTTGSYIVTLGIVDINGCLNSVSHTVIINPQPSAMFSFTSACLGANTDFTDQSFTLNGELITNWHWDFGDATTLADTSDLQNGSYIYNSLGVYNVNLIITSQSGCQDTATQTIQVYGRPTASYSYTAAPCKNNAVYFQDSSFNQQATIVNWNWEFGPGSYSTLQNPVYVFYAADSCYDVKLTATDNRGCVDDTTMSVCVPAEFNITFSAPPTCLRDSTFFTPQLLAPLGDSMVFFSWNFGDPTSGIHNTSTLEFPSHLYSAPGTYTVGLQVTDINNCPKTVYLPVTIMPLPLPSFSFTAGVCDSTITFDESSSGNGSGISQWIWNFGDGFIDTITAPNQPDTTHLYSSPNVYIVSLAVTNANGCTNVYSDTNVLVKPCIIAEFELYNDTLICQNNMLAFADSSYSGLPTNEWYWDFGDGTDTTYYAYTNPVNHTYTTSGTFFVKLKIFTDVAGQQVSDSTILKVVVSPTPLPDFTFGVVCDKQKAVFTNMTSGNGTQIVGYAWTFGDVTAAPNDTSQQKNPEYLYAAPGTYDIKLIAENSIGCIDSIQKTLTVYGLPDANYQYTLSCAGDNTAFTDISVVAVAPLLNWEWTFSNSSGIVGKDIVQNPEFIFTVPGNYLVNLMVTDTNGCVDTINKNVITWNIPTSIFSYSDNFNDVQGQLQFTNISIDAVNNYWDFGNGQEAYDENPVSFYQNEGTYEITLITWNDKECSDTLTMEYKFMVKGLYIPTAFSPANPKESVRLLKPVGVNLKEYRFEVYDRWGNQLWYSDKLDAAGRPSEGWDGKYNGVLMQQGAYVWKAYGIFKDDSIWEADNIGNNDKMPKFKTGTATMIR